MELVDQFEAARPRLMSLAYRIVGSQHDAEDAVQTAWTRVQAADPAEVINPEGWFTTVTARLCLDLLRHRERRGELPLLADDLPSEQLSADEAYLRREEAGQPCARPDPPGSAGRARPERRTRRDHRGLSGGRARW